MDSRSLLVTDVDNTMLGDDGALEKFAAWLQPRRQQLLLAYASGRFVRSILESVRTTALPEPDAVIGGVGTQIQIGSQTIDDWPLSLRSYTAAEIRSFLLSDRRLIPQPDHLQSDHKLSYYAHDLTDTDVRELETSLSEAGFDVNLVYSSQRDLDILPAGVNKGSAAAWLAEQLQVCTDRVIVAGDSGNDLELFRREFRGIVVANAQPEIRTLNSDRIFHSDHFFAAGVLDGIQHWLFVAT